MAKTITVTELKAMAKEHHVGEVTLDGTVEELKDVRVKTYLPILKKIELANVIFNSTDELTAMRSIIEDMILRVEVVRAYTNVNLPTDMNLAYDLISKLNIYDYVMCIIPEQERIDLEAVLNNYKKDREEVEDRSLSVGARVGSFLTMLSNTVFDTDKTEELIEKASKEIAGLDKEVVADIKSIYEEDKRG